LVHEGVAGTQDDDPGDLDELAATSARMLRKAITLWQSRLRAGRSGSRSASGVLGLLDRLEKAAALLEGRPEPAVQQPLATAVLGALRDSEERFRLLVEMVSDYAIYLLDPQGNVESWNAGAERIKGYRAEEILGRHFSTFFTPEDVAAGRPARALETALREGCYRDEAWRVRKDGSRFWASAVLTALRDEGGQLRGYAKVTRDFTEHRRNAEALRQSEERLSAILDSIGEGVIATDGNGLVTRLNPVAERLTGWSQGEALGRPLSEVFRVVDEDTRRPADDPLARALEEGTSAGLPSHPVLIARDGRESPIVNIGAPIRGADGLVRGSVLTFRDVSQQRQAEEAERRLALETAARRTAEEAETRVRVSEELYRQQSQQLAVILKGVADGITAHDAQGTLLYANEAAARSAGAQGVEGLLAMKPGEWLARFDVFDEKGRPVGRDQLPGRRALAGEEHPMLVVRLREKSTGRESWTQIKSEAIRDQTGEAYLAVNIWRDVTEARQQQQTARFLSDASAALASALDYRATLEKLARLSVPTLGDWCAVDLVEEGRLVSVAVAHTDPTRVAMATEMRRRYPPDLDDGRGSSRVIRTGEPMLVAEVTEELLLAGARDAEHLTMVRALGLRSVMIVPLTARGRTLGTLTLVSAESGRRYGERDLDLAVELGRRAAMAVDNARLYREANEAIRLRDDFLSIAGHELKTPLAAQLLQVEGLLRQLNKEPPLERPRVIERLKKALSTGVRLESLIDELLDVSRISSGRLKLELETLDLAPLVEDVFQRSADEAARAATVLSLQRLGEPAVGHWDRLRLDQVITNLVSNALKYGGGKPVEVTVEGRPGSAVVRVRDQGIGIAPEHQGRIFERFERAVSERVYGGLGLGLWITRQIVAAHAGTIRVESAPGAGATFVVELPR
jgi:PAS domain S-box-containing protein